MKRTPSSAVSLAVSLAALPLMLSVLAAPALAKLPPLSEEAKAEYMSLVLETVTGDGAILRQGTQRFRLSVRR